jgi:hypothetical protein
VPSTFHADYISRLQERHLPLSYSGVTEKLLARTTTAEKSVQTRMQSHVGIPISDPSTTAFTSLLPLPPPPQTPLVPRGSGVRLKIGALTGSLPSSSGAISMLLPSNDAWSPLSNMTNALVSDWISLIKEKNCPR